MDYLLRFLAALLLLGGVPFFLILGVLLGGVIVLGPPGGSPSEQATKFYTLYTTFASAGLVSAAGGVLWAVVNVAYPRKAKAKPDPAQRPTGQAA
jgi:hypothetical protein